MTSGVISLAGLINLGWSRQEVTEAVATGALTRIKRGWFARPTAHSWAVEAIRHGGRLGCLSACRLYGIWTPYHTVPHIVVRRNADHKRAHWHRQAGPLPEAALFPLQDCLAQAIRHHTPEESLSVLESAVNQGRISPTQAQLLIAEAPGGKLRQLKFFDPRSESGSETKVRLWLQSHRFPVRTQVTIPGVGRVDFVVGTSLIIECDSREHHLYSDEDFRRDMAARALGYTPIRLSYHQIHHEWERTAQYLLQLLRTRQHLRVLRPH